MKSRIVCWAVIIVSSLGLVACGGGGGSSSSSSAPSKAAIPTLSYTQVKGIVLSWTDQSNATFYRVQENPDGASGFTQIGTDITQGTGTATVVVPLYKRVNARYILQTCNANGCIDANEVSVSGNLAASVGYFKASNTGVSDRFGESVSLSGDGNTLAVGATQEGSSATGLNGDQSDDSAFSSGAVYVFTLDDGTWSQQAYIKASNTESGDEFGYLVSLSDDGNTLAVSALSEASNATGIDDNQNDNSAVNAGAVYVFTRNANSWSQQAYIKASNTDSGDLFGWSISLSSDGETLAVGASREGSDAIGIDGDQGNNNAIDSGAVYIFVRSGSTWSQQAYIKSSNSEAVDSLGQSVSLSSDGNILAASAPGEDSGALGIDGDQSDNSIDNSGAVYIFTRSGLTWSQQAYIKASNPGATDLFGVPLSLSGDGSTLAVNAANEDSSATGIDGDQSDNSVSDSGATYIFVRSGGIWSQQAYIKASNTGIEDEFGRSLSLSGDGTTMAVGSFDESSAIGVGGDQSDNSARRAGAVYIFTLDGGTWSQQAYVKASNTEAGDRFGSSLSLSDDASTLAVGANFERSNATSIGGDQSDNSNASSGAIYLY